MLLYPLVSQGLTLAWPPGKEDDHGMPAVEKFRPELSRTMQLRSATEGRGVPNLEFSHYAVVPRNVQEDIIASRK